MSSEDIVPNPQHLCSPGSAKKEKTKEVIQDLKMYILLPKKNLKMYILQFQLPIGQRSQLTSNISVTN